MIEQINFLYILKTFRFSDNLTYLFFLLSRHKFSSIAIAKVVNFNEEKREKKEIKIRKPKCLEYKSIAMVFMAMLFFSCTDTYKRVGSEAKKKVFPVGVAENFTLTYTETKETKARDTLTASRVIAVLEGPIREDYQNLTFPYQIFPDGLLVDFFDDKNQKSIIKADYGIIYSATNLIDLQGNVVLETHDGKKLETPQLFYDQVNEWVFTQKPFKYTNPEESTVMNGEGMDFNKELSLLNAHKVYGLMMIKEEKDD